MLGGLGRAENANEDGDEAGESGNPQDQNAQITKKKKVISHHQHSEYLMIYYLILQISFCCYALTDCFCVGTQVCKSY